MKIGIDITQLNYVGTGVANYTYQLVRHLLQQDKKNEYKLFFSSFRQPNNFYYLDDLKKLGAKIYRYRFPTCLLRVWWEKRNFFPIDWFTGRCDVFFFSDFLRPPVDKKTKGITTVHDLTWMLFPQYHTKNIINAHQVKLEKTIKYDDEIIVDSENTKKDLLNLYPQIKKDKIHVIYPGVDEQFRKINDAKKIEEVINKYLKRFPFYVSSFILYVGAIEPRKNLDKAIRIFHQLINLPVRRKQSLNIKKILKQAQDDNNNPFDYSDFKFLIIGRAGWKNEKIFQLVNQLNLKKKVLFLGYVADEDLPYFYNKAKATIYLSSYEGFGLPPVEAAKCQTPVLLYQNSSLKEIFNEKYPYAKEGKELETLKSLIDHPINPEKYLKKEFSWKKTANEFLCLINNLVNDY